jgi:lysozyme
MRRLLVAAAASFLCEAMDPKIVDLSHHQPDVQFGELKASGIEAVILKATQGTYRVDPKFTEYVTRARSKGLEVGAYHFMTGEDAKAQLEFFLATVEPYRRSARMVLCLDYEHNPNAGGQPTPAILAAMVQGMVKRLGRHPVLYGSDAAINALLKKRGTSSFVRTCRRWIARYNDDPPVTDRVDIWQYTQEGQIKGVKGNVDLNRMVSQDYPTVEAFWRRFEI